MQVFEVALPSELSRIDALGHLAREIQRGIAVGGRDLLVLHDRKRDATRPEVVEMRRHREVEMDDVGERIDLTGVADDALHAAEHLVGQIGDV